MSGNRVVPVKTSPLPSNMKDQWDEAFAQLYDVVHDLNGDTAHSFIRKFAAAAVRDECSRKQLGNAFHLTRQVGMGDIFVLARADAESALDTRKRMMEIGNAETPRDGQSLDSGSEEPLANRPMLA
ncbi:hypothetical protein AB5N19_13046 [Seiridium cardinale]